MYSFSVVMLGGRESGKTVFLASMYYKMSTQGRRGFFLETDDESSKKLLQIYQEIYPGRKECPELWPAGNQLAILDEWKFTCNVESKNSNTTFPTCEFNYLDYAGRGLIGQGGNIAIDKKIENADILLGLLDGIKLMSYMKGEYDGQKWVVEELQRILIIFQKSRKNVYFLVSKWDIVEEYYDLETVKNKLLEIQAFQDMISLRNGYQFICRLIPVSSVGKGFAELQKEPDGNITMNKIPGIQPKPFNVEMPFACLLQDKIQVEINKLIEDEKKLKTKELPSFKPNFDWYEGVVNNIGKSIKGGTLETFRILLGNNNEFNNKVVEPLLNNVGEKIVGKRTVESITEKERKAKETREKLAFEQQESFKKVIDEKTAYESVINSFAKLVYELEEKFPECIFDNDINLNE